MNTQKDKTMTRNIRLILWTGILLVALLLNVKKCHDNQTKIPSEIKMDNYQLKPETSHPNARKLMTDDFFWSPIEETAPFGSDDGSDAFYRFRQWRQSNKTISPTAFVKELSESWGYKSDEAIVAIGFGQFVLEGKIDNDIKEMTKTILKKQLEPDMIDNWDGEYQKTRKAQLTKMLETLDKMNER